MALVEMNEELSCLVSPAKDRCDGLQHRVGSKYKWTKTGKDGREKKKKKKVLSLSITCIEIEPVNI